MSLRSSCEHKRRKRWGIRAESPISAAGRDKSDRLLDWNDVRGILVRQGTESLDWPYILHYLEPLCEVKEAPEILDQLKKWRKEVG